MYVIHFGNIAKENGLNICKSMYYTLKNDDNQEITFAVWTYFKKSFFTDFFIPFLD